VIDETLKLFRAQVFFKNFEVTFFLPPLPAPPPTAPDVNAGGTVVCIDAAALIQTAVCGGVALLRLRRRRT